jgi:hypothetical protein
MMMDLSTHASPNSVLTGVLSNRLRPTTAVLAYCVALLVAVGGWERPAAGQFFPPGIVNPFADVDPGEDLYASHVIEDDGTMHVVWASSNPYPGIGDSDPDILYSKNEGSGWSAPVAVNSWATTDSNVDERPRLAIGPSGRLYCVWQSQYDYAGAGNDWDIFYRQFDPSSGWGTVEAVNSGASTDNVSAWNNETMPSVAVRGDGGVIFMWQYENGTDPGLYWRWRNDSGWGMSGLVYASQAVGPTAMSTAAQGNVVIAWEQTQTGGGNHLIRWSEFPSGGAPASSGGQITNGSTDDRYPAVATYGSGGNLERHFVWASKDDSGGIGTDFDIKHYVRREGNPGILGPYTVNSTAASDGSSDDVRPSICVEPGGVLHVVWQSNVDILSGTDLDTYYAHNGTLGSQWSPIGFLGLNAPFDNPGEDDFDPEIRCTSNHWLSGMWTSIDDLGGTVGSDRDVFHALGVGRGYHRSRNIVDWAENDTDYDGQVRVAQRGGVVHLIWESANPGGGLSTGPDPDIYHVAYRLGEFGMVQLVNTNRMDGLTGDDRAPDIAVGPQGLLHAVWSSEDNIGGTTGTDFDIFYAWTDETGIWSVPELIHSSGTSDSIDDLGPLIEVDADGNLHVLWYQMLTSISGQLTYARRTNTGWTTSEIPTVPTATDWSPGSYDLAVEPGGIAHLVWNSGADHGGAGSDSDIFWSQRVTGTWATAELVNDYGSSDSSPDETPRVAVAPDGEVYAVWAGSYDGGGAGNDYDLFIVKRDSGSGKAASSWQGSFLLIDHFGLDSGDDRAPDLAVGAETIDVVWESDDGLAWGAAGTDLDVFHVRVPRTSSLPADVGIGVANANGFADSGDDEGVAVAIAPGGIVVVVWESEDTLGGRIGSDSDVILGRLGEIDGIFFDGFESGSTAMWSFAKP